ncbi:hypothetical protein V8C86DRAFT_2721220 [Haematococcus lacustris]
MRGMGVGAAASGGSLLTAGPRAGHTATGRASGGGGAGGAGASECHGSSPPTGLTSHTASSSHTPVARSVRQHAVCGAVPEALLAYAAAAAAVGNEGRGSSDSRGVAHASSSSMAQLSPTISPGLRTNHASEAGSAEGQGVRNTMQSGAGPVGPRPPHSFHVCWQPYRGDLMGGAPVGVDNGVIRRASTHQSAEYAPPGNPAVTEARHRSDRAAARQAAREGFEQDRDLWRAPGEDTNVMTSCFGGCFTLRRHRT